MYARFIIEENLDSFTIKQDTTAMISGDYNPSPCYTRLNDIKSSIATHSVSM